MRLFELNYTIPLDKPLKGAAEKYFTTASDEHNPNIFLPLGWKPTGYGRVSMVYTNPNKPYVLKINYTYDRGFAWYAMLTHKFPNPHFPVIGNMKLVKIGKVSYYVYLIEKLNYNAPNELPLTPDIYNYVIKHPENDLSTLSEYTREKLKQEPLFLEALRIIGSNAKKSRIPLHPDLTTANIMKRDDGTLVISDPLSD